MVICIVADWLSLREVDQQFFKDSTLMILSLGGTLLEIAYQYLVTFLMLQECSLLSVCLHPSGAFGQLLAQWSAIRNLASMEALRRTLATSGGVVTLMAAHDTLLIVMVSSFDASLV